MATKRARSSGSGRDSERWRKASGFGGRPSIGRRTVRRPRRKHPQVVHAVERVDPEKSVHIIPLWYIHERKHAEVSLQQRNVCREPGHAFVHVIERLEIRNMDNDEELLFGGIFDGGGCGKDLFESVLDRLRHFQRVKDRAGDARGTGAQATAGRRVRKQVARAPRLKRRTKRDVIGMRIRETQNRHGLRSPRKTVSYPR